MKNKESEKLGELEKGYRLISEELDSKQTISEEFVESIIRERECTVEKWCRRSDRNFFVGLLAIGVSVLAGLDWKFVVPVIAVFVYTLVSGRICYYILGPEDLFLQDMKTACARMDRYRRWRKRAQIIGFAVAVLLTIVVICK